ncbi:hypothetical protein GCM10010156_20960 [Planobispora rosea]|uniref:Uncharacterized protein n=1 Tax=Planobispora rosea TaxID=35762 RepID=A0A8J3WDZ2_PLARO|nr:hypothetical protein [Planobispora rosea]GGS62013.1 hypothetical protein GCM10010156_20960 [Planobispora rosea]GIH84391.1 hypothetical protein Pro02_27990 [Planobispora rosea]
MPGDSPAAPAGRASRSRERFRPRRAAWFQWAAASVLALFPLIPPWVLEQVFSSLDRYDRYPRRYEDFLELDMCAGSQALEDHGWVVGVLYEVPVFWFGALPFVVVSFAAWLAGNRLGRPGIGRVVTRISVALVGLVFLFPLPAIWLDTMTGPHCRQALGGSSVIALTFTTYLITGVCLVLMLRAVRPPHARRSGAARVALCLSLVPPMLLLPVSDAATGRISGSEVCSTAEGFPIDGLGELEGEARFLCAVRGGPWGQGSIRAFEDMPDEQVLAYGRHLCAAAVRAGGDANEREPYEEVGLEHSTDLAEGLRAICPQVVAVEKAEAERERLAEERKQAALEAKCAAYPPHRPSIRPVRRAAGAVHTDYNALVALEDEDFEMIEASPLLVKGLVGAEPGIVQVTVANEFATVCVTAEAYDRRPPLERRGWDTVREIPYRSTRGNLAFVDFYGGRRLVNLTVAGKGGYRVRVHVRGSEEAWKNGEDAVEQFLIMVYPGNRR